MKRNARSGEILDQAPPHDLHAELMLLRAIVLDRKILDDAADLGSGHFHVESHRKIFAAIARLREDLQPIDIAHLRQALIEAGALDAIGGAAKLAEMLTGDALPARTDDYLRVVREFYAKRLLRRTAEQMLQKAADLNLSAVEIVADVRERLASAEAEADGTRAAGARVEIVPLSQVKPKRNEWLWPARFPLGKLSLVTGDPGDGKSLLLCDVAGRVTTKRLFPCSADRAPMGKVLLCSCEDDAEDTIAPRMMAAGADLGKVMLFAKGFPDPVTGRNLPAVLNLATDMPLLEQALIVGGYRLVVLDTITGFMGKIDNNSATDVRSVLTGLVDLAARHRVAVVGISHLTKNSATAARYRTTGSVAYNAVARSVLAVGRHQDDHDLRLLAGIKTNLGPAPSTLGYRVRVKDINGDSVPYIEWEAKPIELSADEFLSPKAPPKAGTKDGAVEWLDTYLSDGPRPARDAMADGTSAGYSERTIKRAKDELGIIAHKAGMDGGWLWCRPSEECLLGDWHPSDSSGKNGTSVGTLRGWQPGVVGSFEVGQIEPEEGQQNT